MIRQHKYILELTQRCINQSICIICSLMKTIIFRLFCGFRHFVRLKGQSGGARAPLRRWGDLCHGTFDTMVNRAMSLSSICPLVSFGPSDVHIGCSHDVHPVSQCRTTVHGGRRVCSGDSRSTISRCTLSLCVERHYHQLLV